MNSNNHYSNNDVYVNIYQHVCQDEQIFVFGSNAMGRHGLGAAKTAADHYGAIYGQANGRMGSSYGIMTKGEDMRPLPLHQIAEEVQQFIQYAKYHKDLIFFLTPIGCGFAGYRRSEIRPFFVECDWGGKTAIDVQLASRIRWARSWLYGQ